MRARQWITLATCLAVLLSLGVGARKGWAVSQRIKLGDRVIGTLGDMHPFNQGEFPFSALEGTKFKVSVKAGGSLRVEVSVLGPDGEPVGGLKIRNKRGGKKVGISGELPEEGDYTIWIRALNDSTGRYRMKTNGRLPVVRGVGEAQPGVEQGIRFKAVARSRLVKLAVTRKGHDLDLSQRGTLRDPEGADVPIQRQEPGQRRLLAKGADLHEAGTYTFSFTPAVKGGAKAEPAANGAPGQYEYLVKVGLGEKTSYNLGGAATVGTIERLASPVLPAADGYVGSDVCQQCHGELFYRWSKTSHNLIVRRVTNPGLTGRAVVADADDDGVDDFREGLDLSTHPEFAAFGENSPKLLYVQGDPFPYKVMVGPTTYDVIYTLGGNGYWKQRYLTRIGDSHFILPVQYNERGDAGIEGRYSAYYPDQWYDQNNDPIPPGDVDPNGSYERRCVGCHSTGPKVELNARGQFVMGMAQFNVGCEACHGPGAAHAQSGGNPTLIVNPAELLDGTAEGVLAADSVCGRCHTRGSSVDNPAGADQPLDYPYNVADGIMGPEHLAAGKRLGDFLKQTTDPGDYWDLKDNPMGFAPTPGDLSDDTYVASKSNHQQFIDQQNGPHASDKPWDGTCFDCHSPHGSSHRHLVAKRLTREGETFETDIDDNSLCLACHKGHGPFVDLTAGDVHTIATGFPSEGVVQAVVDHMKDIAMPVMEGAYDPQGSGVGRCASCHMVKSSVSAVYMTDRAGYSVGDVAGHTFLPIAPFVSRRTLELQGTGLSNSCSRCHPTDENDEVGTILMDFVSDPDDDGTFHADVPRNFQTAVANAERDGGVACVACHTTEGFVRIQVQENDIHFLTGDEDAEERTAIIKNAIGQDHGILCHACHGKDPAGGFAQGRNPLRFPREELCGKCHNDETVRFADFKAHGEIVRHPQREMLGGTAGIEIPGTEGTYADSFHSTFPEKCVACHYDTNTTGLEPSHTFEPDTATCKRCHGIDTFDRISPFAVVGFGDWDGNGLIEGIQTEIRGLLGVLEDALLASGLSWSGSLFTDSTGDSGLQAPEVTDAQRRSVFNWYSVDFDGSFGVHNAHRSVRLLQQSYKELTGTNVPNADIR